MKRVIQQQVQEIRFENVIIDKLKKTVSKNGSLYNWLQLLKAYQQNQLFSQKEQAIKQMHRKFILKQSFWIKQIQRKLNDKFLRSEDINFMFLAFDDGYYEEAANRVYKRLIQEAINKQKRNSNLGVNYLISKIEKLISLFYHQVNYYPGLRKVYLELENQKKVRDTFVRQIKQAYDDLDITYQEYKMWEPDISIKQKNLRIYEEAKQKWQKRMQGDTNIYELLRALQETNPFDSVGFLEGVQSLTNEHEKLWYLRRICLQRHQLVCEYLEKLQNVHVQDEQLVMDSYTNVINFSPQAEMAYLKFLVRRFNRQIYETVSQQYNNTWAQKVTYFRQQIKALIEKKRLTPKTEQSIKDTYFIFWTDVETALIRSKDSLCQIFQSYLKFNPSVSTYTKYSKSLIQIGYYKDAKQVLKRSCQAFKYDFEAQKQYQKFLAVYGSISDMIDFRKAKNIDRKQKNIKQVQENNKKNEVQIQGQIPKQECKVQKKEIVPFQNLHQLSINSNSSTPLSLSESEQINQNRRQRSQKNDKQIKQISAPKKRTFTDSGKTLFIKGIHSDWDEQKVRQIIKYKDSIKQIRFVYKNDKKQNYCYVEMDSQQSINKQQQQNQHKKYLFIAKSKPTQSDSQQRTLFLCGLPNTTTEEKIKQTLSEYQSYIISIRLKIEEQKSYAYVEMPCKQLRNQVLQALKPKKLVIDNKIITLKESNSQKSQSKNQKKVIILKNLAYKATEADIVEFFQNDGIEEVNIPKNQQGKVRGFAFVKFNKQQSFQIALQKKSGKIKGRQFQIQKSERDIFKYNNNINKKNPQKTNNFFSNMFK